MGQRLSARRTRAAAVTARFKVVAGSWVAELQSWHAQGIAALAKLNAERANDFDGLHLLLSTLSAARPGSG
jgi:hypothetical protein